MTYANENECRAAGVDPAVIERICRGLSRHAEQAAELGLFVFGGAGTGTLRTGNSGKFGPLILGTMHGLNYSGGDGAEHLDERGLWRGEGDLLE